ncbi:MAG: hypothetical protein C4524_14465 [Candidatus Zixiibacteriota bacterium]|nr:MAG: hypothetical protein C4524_14465 [candidate division Zixibacteria bacterium]
MLKRLWARCVLAATVAVPLLALKARAGGEGLDIPEALENTVNLEGLSGISLFFAKTYNENMLLYAVICTVLMAALGMAIALVTDVILKMMGMEVGKIEHKE